MLSTSHNRAYQYFLTLLTEFDNSLPDLDGETNFLAHDQKFKTLQHWFEENIVNLTSQGIEAAIVPRWESIQREIKREFKLLTTDILFLASARQSTTKIRRLQSISDRNSRLINYCQGLLQDE